MQYPSHCKDTSLMSLEHICLKEITVVICPYLATGETGTYVLDLKGLCAQLNNFVFLSRKS